MPKPDIKEAFELSLKLSRLSVDASERDRLSGDLDNILGYVEAIEAVDTSAIKPLRNPLELASRAATPLRPDSLGEGGKASDEPKVPGAESDHLYIVPEIIKRDD